MGRIPIALQVYSVRNEAKADLAGTLQATAEMGYEGVEFAGFYEHPATEIRKMLDDNGLVCCGSHQGYGTLLGDELQKTVEFNQILGNPYLICPGLPGECRGSRDAWLKTAETFNTINEKLRPQHMWTGYHNHNIEFTPLDGELPWDTFFGHTAGDVVMQLDMGNGLSGNADLLGILRRYPGRATTVHLKPYDTVAGKSDLHAGYKPLIGEDSVPWQEVFELCETTAGARWYIVEYESDKYPPLEAVKRCLDALKAMGK